MQAEQITMVNEGPRGEITAVPRALLGDEKVPDRHMIPQVTTRSRSKRRIVNIDPSQNDGVKNQNMKGTRSGLLILSRNSWMNQAI